MYATRLLHQFKSVICRSTTLRLIQQPGRKLSRNQKIYTSCARTEWPQLYEAIDHLSNNRIQNSVYFGQDEFPTDKSKEHLLSFSNNYNVNSKANSKTLGHVFIMPSNIFRHQKATYADVRILPDIGLHHQHNSASLCELLEGAVYLTNQLGYEAAIYQSFISNVDMIRQLRMSGFAQLAVIPRSGYTFDMGWQESVVFMKTLKNIEDGLQNRSKERASSVWMKQYLKEDKQMTTAFPISIYDKNNKEYLIDKTKLEDAEALHDVFFQVCKEGVGFTPSDIMPLEQMIETIKGNVPGSQYFTFWDPTKSPRVAGGFFVSADVFSRSTRPRWCNAAVFVDPKYRKTGLMATTMPVHRDLVLDLGHDGIMCKIYADNVGSLHTNMRAWGTVVGYYPFVGYLEGKGWTDAYVVCHDYRLIN